MVITFKHYLSLRVSSLGKACLEHTVGLLAPELALKKVGVNAVSRSFIQVGINKPVSQRQMMIENATVPMGRLFSIEDGLRQPISNYRRERRSFPAR